MWNLFHYIFLGVVDFNSFRGIARIIIGILPRNRSKFPKKVWIYKKFVLFLLQKICHTDTRRYELRINLSVSHSLDSSPDRRASGETVSFAGTAKASPIRGGGIAQR